MRGKKIFIAPLRISQWGQPSSKMIIFYLPSSFQSLFIAPSSLGSIFLIPSGCIGVGCWLVTQISFSLVSRYFESFDRNYFYWPCYSISYTCEIFLQRFLSHSLFCFSPVVTLCKAAVMLSKVGPQGAWWALIPL